MPVSKHDIRVAAKERHPNAVNIRCEAKEDFKIPGVVEVAGEHPGIRVIVNSDGCEYVYEADTRDEVLAKLLQKRDKADGIKPADPAEKWKDEAILALLRRQVAELKETREQLKRNRDGRPADDNAELVDIILELRSSIRQLADDFARELNGEKLTGCDRQATQLGSTGLV